MRVSGHFRGDGDSLIKAGEKGDKIRDQDRGAGSYGDGSLLPVKFPDLFDHGPLLHKQAPFIMSGDAWICIYRTWRYTENAHNCILQESGFQGKPAGELLEIQSGAANRSVPEQ